MPVSVDFSVGGQWMPEATDAVRDQLASSVAEGETKPSPPTLQCLAIIEH